MTTTTTAAEPDRLDLGRVISETFAVIGRNIVAFAVLGLVLSGIPVAIVSYFQFGMMRAQLDNMQAGNFNFSLASIEGVGIGGLATLVTTAILQGALIYATVQDLGGKPVSIGSSLATGLRNFLPLLGVTILFGLAVAGGFILLIVPGLMIATAWCVSVPALVAERTGVFGAFSRSSALTRGNRWRIFGLAVLIWIVLVVLGGVTNAIIGIPSNIMAGGAAAFDRLFSPLSLALIVIRQTIGAVLGSTLIAVLYVELRRAREHSGPQWLADIFS